MKRYVDIELDRFTNCRCQKKEYGPMRGFSASTSTRRGAVVGLDTDCWYSTPPAMVSSKQARPKGEACLSHISTLMIMVRSLFVTPMTVKAVAEIAVRHA